jgi:hypothetical protein
MHYYMEYRDYHMEYRSIGVTPYGKSLCSQLEQGHQRHRSAVQHTIYPFLLLTVTASVEQEFLSLLSMSDQIIQVPP